jgi:SAM-dependent methyltransferase|tara:strand:- start:1938 stop:2519 length:582 start_codon:yes stop_codon:yes gene_type:complete
MSVDYYNSNSESFIKDTRNIDMKKNYEVFLANVPDRGLILDAGCGSGRDSLIFQKLGYRVDAFDGSSSMVSEAKKLTGLNIELSTFEDFEFNRSYNGIWACASLLHVRRANLVSILTRLSEGLISGGVLYSSFKYGNNERLNGERYFNDINEHVLKAYVDTVPDISVMQTWVTGNRRTNDNDEKWLNSLLLKA